MKKPLAFILIVLCTVINPYNSNAQTKKDQSKPKPSIPSTNQPSVSSIPDSVVKEYQLTLTPQEYVTILNVMNFLLSTDLKVSIYTSFQEAILKAKQVVIANPNKLKTK